MNISRAQFFGEALRQICASTYKSSEDLSLLCALQEDTVRSGHADPSGRRLLEVCAPSSPRHLSSLESSRASCGSALAIEHSGDLYSCDHFVYPQNRLGNIVDLPPETLVASEQQRSFGQAKESTLPRYCRECDVRFACNGECPKHRFPYMRFMAGELAANRAPANVMRWTAAQDRRRALEKAGRNNPCPCGSGRKFKHCCLGKA